MISSSEPDFFYMTLELQRPPFEDVAVRAASGAFPDPREQIGMVQGEKALLSLLSAVSMAGYFVVSNERGRPPGPTFYPCAPEQLVGFLKRPGDQLNSNIAKLLADQPVTQEERLAGRHPLTRVNVYSTLSFENGLRRANETLSADSRTG